MARIDQSLFYIRSIERHGFNARGVAWSDEMRQRRRFTMLLKQIKDIRNRTVVDAGCGFGDLYLHMREKSLLPKRYIGIDMLDVMVEEARKRTGRNILRRNMLKDPLPEADWYLASGSFNLLTRFETLLAIKRCLDAANRGIVFNLLEGKERDGTFNHWLPREIEKACRPFGRVTLYEGYLEGDFTVRIDSW
ncbi:class I SAM-dependent methyltransferase [Hydrogenimonas cancrithermarum]|uniref:SAM-dependent methyltransferase n=1 Tax=Hydrogenimonas cancrithermarum TaxID=2993563 RepID=A0ABN6WVI5_9BACT|nr:class I SAM-dependent methyltransferase [Hydrogenimonas cancrithermarum]BDY12851.1 SAM-dependent methyltransferase [Hydrogenimonas cancrithermarum]BDY12968.1 SAM-dependent methyltransferase [Hydrogenimonas cancrithermarum]